LNKATSILLILILSVIPSIIVIPPTASGDLTTPPAVTENSWAVMTPLPAPRSGLGVATVDGKIYAIGGIPYRHEGDTVGTNEMYNPDSNNWTTKAPMPTARSLFGIVAYQGKIYCIGGETNNITAEGPIYGVNLAVNEVYDPETDTWETKAPMPTGRSNLETNVANGKIYVMGGEPNQTLNYAYDPATNNWTVKTPVPNIADGFNRAQTSAASTTFEGKIYWIGIVGFFDYIPEGMVILNQVYDPQTDSWSQRASPPDQLPGPLPEVAAVTTGVWAPKRIYVFGPNHTNYVYDPATDKWSWTKRMEPTHSEFGVAVIDDKVYMIGGAYFYTACELNLQYTPFGYGTVAPMISAASPQNSTFTQKDSLVFTPNKPVNSMNYSLDGQTNSTFEGNLTLTEIPVGAHNVTVYAADAFGNVGTSGTITFNVEQPPLGADSFMFVLVGVVLAAVAVATTASLIYLKKRRKPSNTKPSL
jgi:N-acetylneuraminic acid mutarotase